MFRRRSSTRSFLALALVKTLDGVPCGPVDVTVHVSRTPAVLFRSHWPCTEVLDGPQLKADPTTDVGYMVDVEYPSSHSDLQIQTGRDLYPEVESTTT